MDIRWFHYSDKKFLKLLLIAPVRSLIPQGFDVERNQSLITFNLTVN